MCASCNSKVQHSNLNKKRLSLLFGVLGGVPIAAIGSVLLSPALAAVVPLAALVAACPAMCTIGRVVSWVKGGNEKTMNGMITAGRADGV